MWWIAVMRDVYWIILWNWILIVLKTRHPTCTFLVRVVWTLLSMITRYTWDSSSSFWFPCRSVYSLFNRSASYEHSLVFTYATCSTIQSHTRYYRRRNDWRRFCISVRRWFSRNERNNEWLVWPRITAGKTTNGIWLYNWLYCMESVWFGYL